MADLVSSGTADSESNELEDTVDMEEEEIETLRQAGILPSSPASNRRHKASRKAPRHLIFYENDAEGLITCI
jgi:hypothetical protein